MEKPEKLIELVKLKDQELLDAKQNEKLLLTLIDNIPVYVGIFNEDGRYLMVNSKYERAFFLKRDEIIGKRLRDIIPKENVGDYEPLLKRALNGEEVEFHRRTKMKDGSSILAYGRYVPVKNVNSEVKYVTVYLIDVSELEHVKLELERTNEEKNRILAIISHDVREPLNNIQMLLEQFDSLDENDFKRMVGRVKNDIDPLLKSVNTLLNWSRTQFDSSTTATQIVSISGAVQNVIAEFRIQLKSKDIILLLDSMKGDIMVDPDHFHIIVRNVLQNALKFTEPGGRIEIKTKPSNDKIAILIEDKGVGMSKETIARIISGEMSESVKGTIGERGTGLGLSMCRSLLNKNNGYLEIQSEEGLGSIFSLFFPIAI